ncbi:hypothetical protein K1719_027446 [Acacia pycnantha]|nr:hypothetical protein K1719_027446 [Acacia pycnantha]
MDSSMCSSAPDPEMRIIQGTLAWRTSPVRTVYGQLSLEHRFRFGLNGKIKTEHLTTYLHRPRTTRSPLSFWGDGGIVPFEPFFMLFRVLEKIAINRIFLILPSRKEEREILFPFRRDREIGSSHKKNRMLG